MNKLLLIILSLVLLGVIIGIIVYFRTKFGESWIRFMNKEKYNSINPKSFPKGTFHSFGNLLNQWVLSVIELSKKSGSVNVNVSNKNNPFIQLLNETLLQNISFKQLNSIPDSCQTSDRYWSEWNMYECKNKDYWIKLRPILYTILNKVLTKLGLSSNIKYPVLHLRCNDSPFNGHFHYTLPHYNYYNWVKQSIQKKYKNKYNTWIITTGCMENTRRAMTKGNCGLCDQYITHLRNYLRKGGINTIYYKNRSVLEDFSSFFYTPILITTSPSSMSFIPGVCKKGETYMYPHFRCDKGKQCKLGNFGKLSKYISVYPEQSENIPHQNTNTDWFNVEETTQKLIGYNNILSDHEKFKIGSDELNACHNDLYDLLKVFHTFASQKKIIYSLNAGSLIGYYWNESIIPWDDDIDIIIPKKHQNHIVDLWNNSGNSFNKKDGNWIFKYIILNGVRYELIRNKYNPDWFKLGKLKYNYFNKDIGGVDIAFVRKENGKFYESVIKNKEAIPLQNMSQTKIVTFGPVITRVINKKEGMKYLDRVYSKKWRIKTHPSLK